MSETWYVLIIVAAALGVFLVLRARRSAEQTHRDNLAESGTDSRDYAQERETNRMNNMSESDQAWQAASLKRNSDNQARQQSTAKKP
jgi:membrane protein implicated in regulation of membrane protease activity